MRVSLCLVSEKKKKTKTKEKGSERERDFDSFAFDFYVFFLFFFFPGKVYFFGEESELREEGVSLRQHVNSCDFGIFGTSRSQRLK